MSEYVYIKSVTVGLRDLANVWKTFKNTDLWLNIFVIFCFIIFWSKYYNKDSIRIFIIIFTPENNSWL